MSRRGRVRCPRCRKTFARRKVYDAHSIDCRRKAQR